MESGNVPAAHAMFLVAGIQVELPTTKGARLILPGVDHKKAAHRYVCTLPDCDGWIVALSTMCKLLGSWFGRVEAMTALLVQPCRLLLCSTA